MLIPNDKKKLGRGMDVLLSKKTNEMVSLDISEIVPNPDQPRKYFDDEKLAELAESIRQYGIIQPLVVKKDGDKYRIVAGERRYRAAQLAGLSKVPAVIFKGENEYHVSLIENLQREDLNPIEVAEAYNELMTSFGYNQEELAQKVGKSRSDVSNFTRLLNLCEEVKDLVRTGRLSAGQARPLIVLTEKEQIFWADEIIRRKLAVRQIEQLLASKKSDSKPQPAKRSADDFSRYEKSLGKRVGAKVQVKPKRNGEVAVTMNFKAVADFEKFSKLLEDSSK